MGPSTRHRTAAVEIDAAAGGRAARTGTEHNIDVFPSQAGIERHVPYPAGAARSSVISAAGERSLISRRRGRITSRPGRKTYPRPTGDRRSQSECVDATERW
jgi:hypothetical protein